MKRAMLLAASLLASCGATSGNGAGGVAVPAITGDACALHQDQASCLADPGGCSWIASMLPCAPGPSCPAGWCVRSQPLDGGPGVDGGVGGICAGCACPGAAGDVCVEQIGGPAIQVPPPITCQALPPGCALPDRCACLAQGTLERCWSSEQVANLCICDNGIR